MRLGFIIGFLIGAGIASLLSMSQEAEQDSSGAGGRQVLQRIRHQTDEAREAARRAKLEKEAEMLRQWEEARHHRE